MDGSACVLPTHLMGHELPELQEGAVQLYLVFVKDGMEWLVSGVPATSRAELSEFLADGLIDTETCSVSIIGQLPPEVLAELDDKEYEVVVVPAVNPTGAVLDYANHYIEDARQGSDVFHSAESRQRRVRDQERAAEEWRAIFSDIVGDA